MGIPLSLPLRLCSDGVLLRLCRAGPALYFRLPHSLWKSPSDFNYNDAEVLHGPSERDSLWTYGDRHSMALCCYNLLGARTPKLLHQETQAPYPKEPC